MSENAFNDSVKYHLTGMYQDWFLDYASYVILERAVPAIEDGLKPVQRRILHAMKCVDDGKMNKVANIVGQTMQYHPHGDASIGDALVQLGQKDLLTGKLGEYPHGRRRGGTSIYRGAAEQVCARHGLQPEDDALDVVVRRAEERAYPPADKVPAAAGAGRGGYCRRSELEDTAA